MNEIILKPSYWASVSGGKDSLFMLNLILSNLNRYPLDGVVHFELEIDYPFIKNVIDYMEKECTSIGIPFFRIKPEVTWMELYEKYGFPTRKIRWCNSKYKLNAKEQLKNFLRTKGKKLICYIGYCVDEERRYKDKITDDEIYPLAENQIEESKILEWAKHVSLFNDYYKFNDRCGCMFCPMSKITNLAYLAKYYPKEYNQFIQLAQSTEEKREKERGKPFSIFQSNPKYNTKYYDFKVKTKYLPQLEQKIIEYQKE